MKLSSKHANLTSLAIQPSGGVNLGDWPANIGDNELTRAYNLMYLPHSRQLATRPAVRCVSSVALSDPIERLHGYNDGSAEVLIGYSDGALLYWTGTAWASIATVAKAPSLLNFNSKLLYADGTGIYSWDGTSTTTITTVIKADSLTEVSNRVVANHVDEPDSVYFSGPEDETDWDTVSGSAVGIRAGFGDLMAVNAFCAWSGTDLIVSKRGEDTRALYRVYVGGTPDGWSASKLSSINAAVSQETMLATSGNLFWYDDTLMSLTGTQAYGDLAVDVQIGMRIAADAAQRGLSAQKLLFLPDWAAILIVTDGQKHYVYAPFNNTFTELQIPLLINSAAVSGGYTYLAGENGHLYRLDTNYADDETAPGVTQEITSVLRTKVFDIAAGEGILRRCDLTVTGIFAGELELSVYGGNLGSRATLATGTVVASSSNNELYEATNLLSAADYALSGLDVSKVSSRARFRSENFAFQARCVGGRVALHKIDAVIALVKG